MTDSVSQSSTFERSCQHWSSDGQAGMDAFYRLAAVDYQLLAEQLSWGQAFAEIQTRFGSPVSLLDVACGSGQFPNALLEFGGVDNGDELQVQYSLLDPSQFSIDVARSKLKPPFQPAQELLQTAQELLPPESLYSVMWATHALYCVPTTELDLALDRMLQSMDARGLGFIAHASRDAHYVKFHDLFLKTNLAGDSLPYCAAEDVMERLKAKLPTEDVVCWPIEYEGTLGIDQPETAELYLQRCLFDDHLSLDDMLNTEPLGSYLLTCRDDSAGVWRFKQQTWLIFFGELARNVSKWRTSL